MMPRSQSNLELAVVSFLINHQDNTVINNLSRCVIHGPGSKSGMSRRRRHESRGNLVRCHASGSEYQGSWVSGSWLTAKKYYIIQNMFLRSAAGAYVLAFSTTYPDVSLRLSIANSTFDKPHMSSTSHPGSGGFVVTPEMHKILQQPGYISLETGGQLLRQLYCRRK
jgi:hypothetical protein